MKHTKTTDIALVSVAAAFICVCSWIQLPSAVPFTMQTFAVLLTSMLLGAKRGFSATALYIMLGVIGLPVFSGFQGGFGALSGATGGFILSFLLISWAVGFFSGKKSFSFIPTVVLSMLAMAVSYLSGVLWYAFVFGGGSVMGAITVCVIPFIIPDMVKIILATFIAKKIQPSIEKIRK